MRTRTRVVAAMLTTGAVLGAGAACASLARQEFARPQISLVSMRVIGIGVTGGSLEVILKIFNPNSYRLDANTFTYQVEVDSIPLAHGTVANRFTVAPKDSTLLRIPLAFTYAGLGAAGRSIMTSGSVNYRVSGNLTVLTPGSSFTVPFAQQGRFNPMGGTP
ncbi:MAG TPA: LEA type 2 family protein [Gemmatimonadaceae bacterium]|nr:LEA type 2 family protein [Gemmatimonadaceae bacterium]